MGRSVAENDFPQNSSPIRLATQHIIPIDILGLIVFN